jgi:hypothetical protein
MQQLPLDNCQSYILARITKLTARVDGREFDRAQALWFVSVALVLIVIGTALLVVGSPT